MTKLWAGRTDAETAAIADDLNRSVDVDRRMYREDIAGSIAHARMLSRQGIISEAEGAALSAGLNAILADLEANALVVDEQCEDIHTFIETALTERLGDLGKKLHTARSRNDQVAADLRLWLRAEVDSIRALLCALIKTIAEKAERHAGTVMPGYTHLQRAQPISFGHHLLAYAAMFQRDAERLADCRGRIDVSPLGSAALAGTSFPIDRQWTAGQLGFSSVCANSIDGVSDRDFVIELLSGLSLIMVHLSRFAEEIIVWMSWEFQFIELGAAFTTGSSIMPQKINPDMAELVRGKTGRVFGSLVAMLTTMKALPLAYNKDMQEDKEAVFDACDTVKLSLDVFRQMLATLTAKEDRMLAAAKQGFINATDLADYLVGKGLAFRDAYRTVGRIVSACSAAGLTLEDLTLAQYRDYSDAFADDLYDAIDLCQCVARRNSEGGTSPASVEKQLRSIAEWLRAQGDTIQE